MTSYKGVVVLANGVFDIFHIGHLRYLQECRAMGDVLVVSVTSNPHVNKGQNRPMFDAFERSEIIRALAIVDDVIIVDDLLDAMKIAKPHVVVKGKEYVGKIKAKHRYYMEQNNIRIEFTDTMLASSTAIISHGFRGG